ncbi:Detected protein of unknown function [Hibiscus syriacus]|uniref:Uncharacterized protein n=1 Tax=Hibiscus syriacus TaxID=106335 RepID=A0A6A3CE23_HIBSY|nr:Detected protein of unknown function [Hibiscus syriacus]
MAGVGSSARRGKTRMAWVVAERRCLAVETFCRLLLSSVDVVAGRLKSCQADRDRYIRFETTADVTKPIGTSHKQKPKTAESQSMMSKSLPNSKRGTTISVSYKFLEEPTTLLPALGFYSSIPLETSQHFIPLQITHQHFDVFATLPPILTPGPVCILGFGAGSAARLMLELYPELRIHGWELDPSVLDTGASGSNHVAEVKEEPEERRENHGEPLRIESWENAKDDNSSLALTGELAVPDPDAWKKKLPRSLKGYVDMWAAYQDS